VEGSGATVADNYFTANDPYDSRAAAVTADGDSSNVDISDNVFEDNGNTSVSASHVSGFSLQDNVISNTGAATNRLQTAVLLSALNDAVMRGNAVIGAGYYGVEVGGSDNLEIDNNLIGSSQEGGIRFWNADGVRSRKVVVSGNDFVANGDQTFSEGAIHLFPRTFADTLEVVANRFVDNYWSAYPVGIWVEAPADYPVHAANNWWGCNEGPFHGLDFDQVCDGIYGGNVDTDPWLVLSLDATPNAVTLPGTSTLTGSLLRNSDGATPPEAHGFPDELIDVQTTSGPGTLSAPQIETSGGSGSVTLASSRAGRTDVQAFFDYGEASASVQFDNPAPAPVRDLTAPVISKVSVDPGSFAVNPYGAAEKLLRRRANMGTVIRYSLSEAAAVTVAIDQAVAGRKRGGKCRRANRSRKRGRRCTSYRSVGKFAFSSKAGANSKPFSGKLGRKSLAAGRYRLRLSAVDAAGNRSKPRQVKFRVVRRA
jgi:hypothetical protein